jgi:hypothetical protein
MWISVNDRLPETDKDVLVRHCGGKLEVKHLPKKEEGHSRAWYPGGLSIENSTHWMELPHPPLY